METKYLRPILTAKEPKNKNVLWCHDGKISYYDKEWKEVSGGGSSETTELSTQVFQDTIKKFNATPIHFYDSIEISSSLIISPYSINVEKTTDFIVSTRGISFQTRSDGALMLPTADSIGDFMFVSKYYDGTDIINDVCLILSTWVLNNISTFSHTINFSTLIGHPIGVSDPMDASKWTLEDCQNILKGLMAAGYFLSTQS